jgi:hypothetical protein
MHASAVPRQPPPYTHLLLVSHCDFEFPLQ